MKKIIIAAIAAIVLMSTVSSVEAKGGGGGGRAGGGGRSSVSSGSHSSSSGSRSSSGSKSTTPSKPSASKPSSRPSSATTKTTSPTAKTVNGKTYSKTGNVVDSNYKPSFRGGYTPPAGSTVYYRESSAMDWLPFYLMMNSNNAHREAVVVEPAKDGQPAKETVVKEEGTDGMYIWNWVITIIFCVLFLALIIWLVNKLLTRNKYA